MRQRSNVHRPHFLLLSLLASAVAGVACGGVPFADAPPGGDRGEGDDGGAETSTITVGPPGTEPGKDAGPDATLPESPDASSDARADGEEPDGPDAQHDAATGMDATVQDASEPVDSAPPDAAPACTGATKLCGSSCVPLTSIDYGCAAASCSPCDLANATNVCSATGECAIGSCNANYADCNSTPADGCETSLTTTTNCGKCGTSCTSAAPYCVMGTTGYACGDNCPDAGPTLCGDTCVDLQTDPSNCGTCSKVCSGAGANATNQCVSGSCEVVCDPSYNSCGGVCVNYTDNNANCGSCGHACASVANGSDTCESSTCTVTCNATYSLCTNTGADTCKDLSNDSNNCGTCGHVCPAITNGSDPCDSKVCTPACNSGYQLCTLGGTSTCVAPDTVHGVFVSKSSTLTTGCGSVAAPCGTIAAGMAVAKTGGLTIMYLDAGTYAEQVTLMSGLTIEGGWLYKGAGVWDMECDGTTDPSTLAIIQPTSIASGPAASIIASGVTATLSTLTVKSLATAAAGQSLYGIFATSGANLTMSAVEVTVAAGGDGAAGSTGSALPVQTPPCSASDGKSAAAAGPNGVATSATYTANGYVPGNGTGGTAGAYGDNGTAGTAGSCETFSCNGMACGADVACTAGTENCGCSGAGTPGCGGPGGEAGTGGTGGGASIGLLVWGATTVRVTGGSLAASNGGNGGAGGASSAALASWPGNSGATGTTGSFAGCEVKTVCVAGNCTTTCYPSGPDVTVPGGGAGGNGGQGSAGGAGAGGSGGDSYAYFAPAAGGGVVNVSGTSSTCGSGGTSSVTGLAGSNGSNTCH